MVVAVVVVVAVAEKEELMAVYGYHDYLLRKWIKSKSLRFHV